MRSFSKISAIENMADKTFRPMLTYADECHHAASATAQEILKKVNARYVYGVSATPVRSDSLEKINFFLLGPVRHKYTALERTAEQGIEYLVYPIKRSVSGSFPIRPWKSRK